MTPKELRRIQAFVLQANATMNAIARPVPPKAPDGWDGDCLDVGGLYRTYNQLPSNVQDIAAAGYELCLQVLQMQGGAATAAQQARYKLLIDMMLGTGLPLEQLVFLRDDPHLTLVPHPDDMAAELAAELAAATMAEFTSDRIDDKDSESADKDSKLPAAADDADDDASDNHASQPVATAVALPGDEAAPGRLPRHLPRWIAAVALVAVACLVVLGWRGFGQSRWTAPAAHQWFTVDRSAQSDDMTVIVSHGERTYNTTQLHVHVVNQSDEPQQAELTVDGEAAELMPSAGPGLDEPDMTHESNMMPPRSIRHQVVEIRDTRHKKTVRVGIQKYIVTVPIR